MEKISVGQFVFFCVLSAQILYLAAAVEWEYIFLPSFAITPKLLRSNKLELLSAASPESHPPNKTPEKSLLCSDNNFFASIGSKCYHFLQESSVINKVGPLFFLFFLLSMICPLWTDTWTLMQHRKSLDFVHTLKETEHFEQLLFTILLQGRFPPHIQRSQGVDHTPTH